jgi:hypothetical protein
MHTLWISGPGFGVQKAGGSQATKPADRVVNRNKNPSRIVTRCNLQPGVP